MDNYELSDLIKLDTAEAVEMASKEDLLRGYMVSVEMRHLTSKMLMATINDQQQTIDALKARLTLQGIKR